MTNYNVDGKKRRQCITLCLNIFLKQKRLSFFHFYTDSQPEECSISLVHNEAHKSMQC